VLLIVDMGAVMFTLAVAVVVPLAVALAVMTTAVAAPGAVYVVLAALAVCAGLNDPHAPTGVQDQSTPALVESPVTVALKVEVAFRTNDAGGALEIAIVVGLVAAEIVTVATAVAPCAVVDVAVMVTVPAAPGAV